DWSSDVCSSDLGQLAVEAVHVLAGELLAHRHDDGQLDRGERLLTTELVPADGLLGTLAVSQRGAVADLASLGELVPDSHDRLVNTDRDLTAQGHQRRLLRRLRKDVPNHRLGKTVRRKVSKTPLHRRVDRVVLAAVSVLRAVSRRNLVQVSHCVDYLLRLLSSSFHM